MTQHAKSHTEAIHDLYDTVLILDFGSQYSHLITRRVRELGVYCELLPCTQLISELKFTPKGDTFYFPIWLIFHL
jgi:GMP synthase (glutamine-hydrolysing)